MGKIIYAQSFLFNYSEFRSWIKTKILQQENSTAKLHAWFSSACSIVFGLLGDKYSTYRTYSKFSKSE